MDSFPRILYVSYIKLTLLQVTSILRHFKVHDLVTSEMKSSGLASFVRLLSSEMSFPMTWSKLWHLGSCLQASKQ